MSAAEVVAFAALSPLGRGAEAVSPGRIGEPARAAAFDSAELAAAGLARPFAASVPGFPQDEHRVDAFLRAAFSDLARDLDVARPGWRAQRIGVALGTSSGGMRSLEKLRIGAGKTAREAAHDALYFSAFVHSLAELGTPCARLSLLLGACASSTLAIGLGSRWLDEGACDLVIVGGFDAECVFVASGFEALRATTSTPPPRPFRRSRDGLALGEGVALLALAPPAASTSSKRAILGFGASCDAVHVTAPDRTGSGLVRAAEHALRDAGIGAEAIDFVSAHGTATPFNDAAEALAIAALTGNQVQVAHAYKSQIGHALGAAGALETLVALEAIEQGLLPATSVPLEAEGDPTEGVRLLSVAEAGSPSHALKLSSAFGGLNAALVLGPARATSAPKLREAYLVGAVHISTNDRLPPIADVKLGRFDALTRLVLAATLALEDELGDRAPFARTGAGIVVGHTLATFETNVVYADRIARRGARAAEPRSFPYTSPNACAGEAAIAFGLTGPAFAVGAGMHAGLEAALVAATFVRAGDAEAMVVIAADAPGDAARAFGLAPDLPFGAVALLVSSSRPAEASEHGAAAALRFGKTELGFDPSRARKTALNPGHLALLPLVAPGSAPESAMRSSASASSSDILSFGISTPRRLESACTSGAFASFDLDPV